MGVRPGRPCVCSGSMRTCEGVSFMLYVGSTWGGGSSIGRCHQHFSYTRCLTTRHLIARPSTHTSNQTFRHTPRPIFLARQVFRVLKPGGTFVFVQRVRGGALQPLLLGGAPAVGGSGGEGRVLGRQALPDLASCIRISFVQRGFQCEPPSLSKLVLALLLFTARRFRSSPPRYNSIATRSRLGASQSVLQHTATNQLCCASLPRCLPADVTTVDMLTEFSKWDFVQADPALQATDLHAVGVAIKPLRQQVGPGGRAMVRACASMGAMPWGGCTWGGRCGTAVLPSS